MGEEHEVDALIERIDDTDFGAQESALVRRALALVSQVEDAEREYRVRLRAMLSAAHHADFEGFMEHFVYCLERHRSDPRRFPEEDGGISVRAYQPRAIRSLMNRLAAPVESLEAVLGKFEEYLDRSGSSRKVALEIRADLAQDRGRVSEAREALKLVDLLPRDEETWCDGCAAARWGELELNQANEPGFLAAFDALDEHSTQCGNSELRLSSLAVLPLARAGRGEQALELHRWGARAARRAGLSAVRELAGQAVFAALTSHPERAVALAVSLMSSSDPDDATERKRLDVLRLLELALAVAEDEGWGEASLPGAARWIPGGDGGTPTVEQAVRAVTSTTTGLAAQLDEHFGGEAFAGRLAATRALRTVRVELDWQGLAPDLAPSGLGLAWGPAAPAASAATGLAGDAAASPRPGEAPAEANAAPSGNEGTGHGDGAARRPRTQQDWLDAVALPALMDDAERAAAEIEGAIAAIADPAVALELFSEAIDVLPDQAPRWYAERAARFASVGMHDHERLERELRDLMVAAREADAADAPRWRQALGWLGTDAARAEVLIHLAHSLQAGGEPEAAADTAAEAVPLALRMPSRSDALWVLGEAASAALAVGRAEEALGYSDAGAELALVGERNALVWMHERGLILSELGREDEAIGYLKRAADVALKHRLWPVAVHLLLQAGGRAYYADLNVQAAAHLRLGRDAAVLGSDPREGIVTQRLAAALEDAGEPDEAASIMGGLLERFLADPADPALAGVNLRSLQRGLGDALQAAGDRAGAERAWRAALDEGRPAFAAAMAALDAERAPEAGPSELQEIASDVANSALGVARLALASEETEEVADLVRVAAQAAEYAHAGSPGVRAEMLDTAAQLLSRVEDHTAALAHAETARELFLQEGRAQDAADALDTRGRILGSMGRNAEARVALATAAAEFEAAGAAPNAALSLWLAGQLADDAAAGLPAFERAWRLLGEEHAGLRARVGESYAEALAESGREAEAAAVRAMIE